MLLSNLSFIHRLSDKAFLILLNNLYSTSKNIVLKGFFLEACIMYMLNDSYIKVRSDVFCIDLLAAWVILRKA